MNTYVARKCVTRWQTGTTVAEQKISRAMVFLAAAAVGHVTHAVRLIPSHLGRWRALVGSVQQLPARLAKWHASAAGSDRPTERAASSFSRHVALRQPKNSFAPRSMRIVLPADKVRLSDLDVRGVSNAAGRHVSDAQLLLTSLMRPRYQMR